MLTLSPGLPPRHDAFSFWHIEAFVVSLNFWGDVDLRSEAAVWRAAVGPAATLKWDDLTMLKRAIAKLKDNAWDTAEDAVLAVRAHHQVLATWEYLERTYVDRRNVPDEADSLFALLGEATFRIAGRATHTFLDYKLRADPHEWLFFIAAAGDCLNDDELPRYDVERVDPDAASVFVYRAHAAFLQGAVLSQEFCARTRGNAVSLTGPKVSDVIWGVRSRMGSEMVRRVVEARSPCDKVMNAARAQAWHADYFLSRTGAFSHG